jgi:hypothetical protein
VKLITRWTLRQFALGTVQFILSGTGFVLALIIIRAMKWKTYGFAVFGKEVPTVIALGGSPTWYYIKGNILPLVPWFVIAILVDHFIIGPITEKIFE